MLVLDMLFVVSAVLFDMLKARQLACVSKSGQKCPAALRSPHGERGLKCNAVDTMRNFPSLSSWRAWIEIYYKSMAITVSGFALLMESVD